MNKMRAVLAITVVAISMYASEGTASSRVSARSVSDAKAGLAAVVPSAWHATLDIEPHELDAWAGTRFIDDEDAAGCARRDFTMVRVNVIERSEPPTGLSFVRRPAHFTARDGSGVTSGYAGQSCESRSQYIGFSDKGRMFLASLIFGRDASARRTRQAYAILDSLKITKPLPSPWDAFCGVARRLDLSRTDLATDPRFPTELNALRDKSPSQTVSKAVRTVTPVVTNPSATHDQVLAVGDDLQAIGRALMEHCGSSPANYFLWAYFNLRVQ